MSVVYSDRFIRRTTPSSEMEKMIGACEAAVAIMESQGLSKADIANALVSYGSILMQDAFGPTIAANMVDVVAEQLRGET